MAATTRQVKARKADEADALLHAAAREPEVLRIPAAKFITLEGTGAPGAEAFQAAIGALYGVAFTLKFANKKKRGAIDFKVPPLEGLWWARPSRARAKAETTPLAPWDRPRAEWMWKLLIRMPPSIGKRDVEAAKAAVRAKRGDGPVTNVALERIAEGLVVQALHVGPYASEPETAVRMRALMAEEGLAPRGVHHEIYLGDPRRAKPEKLRTILRQPVARAALA